MSPPRPDQPIEGFPEVMARWGAWSSGLKFMVETIKTHQAELFEAAGETEKKAAAS